MYERNEAYDVGYVNCFRSQCCLEYSKQRIWDHGADYAIRGTAYSGLKGLYRKLPVKVR